MHMPAAITGFSREAPVNKSVRPFYVVTVITGSFLLFLIQPMFARMALPRLGGSPSVWNIAMLFYQVALLGGYLYAHWLQRLRLRTQITTHVTLLIAAMITLPVAAATWLPGPGTTWPSIWLLGLLAVSIGPAFFIVSAQAPLMQAWFAKTDDPAASAPTFLYAASNIGSLTALLAYPLLIEPTTRLATQGWLWTSGYLVLIALVVVSGWRSLGRTTDVIVNVAGSGTTRPDRKAKLRWATLAFVPSGLLLSTTTHLTTDIMAMPLLWIIPLATYLLSFIFAFGKGGPTWTRYAMGAAPLLLIIFGTTTFLSFGVLALYLAIANIVLLFVLALAFHGTLATEQPTVEHLTTFYLWIAFGGALGGLFCALIAPVVFNWGYEQPILLVIATLLIIDAKPGNFIARLWIKGTRAAAFMKYVLPLITLILFISAAQVPQKVSLLPILLVAPYLIIITLILSVGRRPQFAWHYVMLLMAVGGWRQVARADGVFQRDRSFFGIYAVTDYADLHLRKLSHGTTIHGVQSQLQGLKTFPMSYFGAESGIGRVLRSASSIAGPHARIAFVGLGAGTLACYSRPAQDWTAYEIDPVVVHIASDKAVFSYLDRCRKDLRIVLGDARLNLAREPVGRYDILAIDAFSSDEIPLHLMTAEAFEVYSKTLTQNGVLMVHISNRYLDLEPVVAAIARQGGWTAQVRYFVPPTHRAGISEESSIWVMLTKAPERSASVIAALPGGPSGWRKLHEKADLKAWTDDFSTILPAIKFR